YTPGGFQDRCLKPLGHPSALTTSNTYALPLAEQTSHCRQLATARLRLRSRGRALFGLALSQMNGGHHPQTANHWERIDWWGGARPFPTAPSSGLARRERKPR